MRKTPYLIAEIGINHNGSLDIAKELIKEACESGFDAVKFQKRTIDIVYTKKFLEDARESPFGNTQRAQKEGLEFAIKEYDIVDGYCKDMGIDWGFSAWDVESQRVMRKYDCAFNKIASPMLTHRALLEEVASEKKLTFISTGMSTLDEIGAAVSIFSGAGCEYELMHSVSEYPLKQESANLRCIHTLRDKFNCRVGYSGHESCLIKVSILAVCLGATSVERHITLDRTMYGSDQAASIETRGLRDFVKAMRSVSNIIGDGEKILTKKEKEARSKLRSIEH